MIPTPTRTRACPLCDGSHAEIVVRPGGSLGLAPCSACCCPCGRPWRYVDGEPVCLDHTRYVPSESV